MPVLVNLAVALFSLFSKTSAECDSWDSSFGDYDEIFGADPHIFRIQPGYDNPVSIH